MSDEYPKWVRGVVVDNAEQESAVLEGRATFEVIKSAQGDIKTLAGITPRPAHPPEPTLDEPAEMIAAVQETFTRRKTKRRQD